jgi:hypothetical protein
MSDVRDPLLHDLLDERTAALEPRPDALERVRVTARRRHRRRRVTGGAAALVATTVAISFAGGVLREPATRDPGDRAAASRSASREALDGAETLRDSIGISGPTKGASNIIVAPSPAPDSGEAALAAFRVDTGVMQRALPKNAESASVSPQETTVALVTKNDRVVVESAAGGDRHLLGRQRPGSTISWDPGGTALFAFVDRHWILVPAPDASGKVFTKTQARVLGVPRLPGGPSFLSVSPGKDYVVLYGVSDAGAVSGDNKAALGRPHLYLGRYDGRRVSSVHPLRVPVHARQGPMGWLGDNAFVIGTGAGSAWILRVTGSHLAVAPALPEGCAVAGAPQPCRARGPRLLGTNATGSLLYWRVGGHPASATSNAGAATGGHRLVAFYSTWLDGSHAKRLTGPAGTYGPALAAR